MRRLVVALTIVVAATVLAVPGYAFDEAFERTYPLPAGGSFQLQNVNGSVQISGWDREAVEVHAVKSARQNPSDLARVQIEVTTAPQEVTVETRYPHDQGVEVSVEYRIRVPRRVLLRQVTTVNGAVRVTGVEASGELRAVNGDVEVYDSAGGLSARTTNGNLRLELRALDPRQPIVLEAVNGSIVLALPASAGAELDVSSLNGEFRSDLPVTAQGSLSARQFHGRLGTGGAPLRLRTVNGGIRVLSLRPTV